MCRGTVFRSAECEDAWKWFVENNSAIHQLKEYKDQGQLIPDWIFSELAITFAFGYRMAKEGKSLMELRDFGWALNALRTGNKVTRSGWNGKGMWLALQVPDQHSKMQRPYIYIKTAQDQLVPWVASHGDLLGTDWELLQ